MLFAFDLIVVHLSAVFSVVALFCYGSICWHGHYFKWKMHQSLKTMAAGDHTDCCSNRLRKTLIVTLVLKHYLTAHQDSSILKPQCVHHLAWFYTVIILIQTVKDVTAGVIWHCALTVDRRFNRYSDLYQSNDLLTGRLAFLKGKHGHTKYPWSFIMIAINLSISYFSSWGSVLISYIKAHSKNDYIN